MDITIKAIDTDDEQNWAVEVLTPNNERIAKLRFHSLDHTLVTLEVHDFDFALSPIKNDMHLIGIVVSAIHNAFTEDTQTYLEALANPIVVTI